MKHPVLIGMISIVPGLGYFCLGKLTEANYVLAGLAVSFFIFLFSPYEWLAEIAFYAVFLVWFGQIIWAYREATESIQLENGEVIEAKEVLLSPPLEGLSRREKQVYSISQNINGQGRRQCRAIVLSEYLNKTRTRMGKIRQWGLSLKDIPKGILRVLSFTCEIKRSPSVFSRRGSLKRRPSKLLVL